MAIVKQCSISHVTALACCYYDYYYFLLSQLNINMLYTYSKICNIRKTRRNPEYVQKIKTLKKKKKMSLTALCIKMKNDG